MNQIIIGFDASGQRAVGSRETLRQIENLKSFICALGDADGMPLTWADFYDLDSPRSVLAYLVADREKRIDRNQAMVGHVPFAVVTIEGRRAVRFEFYDGPCTHDLRAKEYRGAGMPLYVDRDFHDLEPPKKLKLSVTRLGILKFIAAEGGKSWQSRIRKSVNVTSTNIQVKMRALILEGYVREIPDPNPGDQQRKWFRLTAKGWKAVRER